MPTKQYTITVVNGPMNGMQFTKFTQRSADTIVYALDVLDMQCEVEIKDLR